MLLHKLAGVWGPGGFDFERQAQGELDPSKVARPLVTPGSLPSARPLPLSSMTSQPTDNSHAVLPVALLWLRCPL